jgi:hypothetical protein
MRLYPGFLESLEDRGNRGAETWKGFVPFESLILIEYRLMFIYLLDRVMWME